MMRKSLTERSSIAIGFLIALRLTVSLFLSDGTVRSDGITYTGLVVNLLEHRSVSAALPSDESAARSGLTFRELYNFLLISAAEEERLLAAQWLHAVLYSPFLFLFPSLATIIVLNVTFLAISGGILFKRFSPAPRLLGWTLLLYYPPFFYLSDNFFSEPLFFALLTLVFSLVNEQRTYHVPLVLCALSLCLTRPLGFACCGLAAVREFHRRKSMSALSLLAAALIAFALNQIMLHPRSPQTPTVHTPSLVEAFYLTNSPLGNGDIDAHYARPELKSSDTVYQKFRNDGDAWSLLSALQHQIFSQPTDWMVLTVTKIRYLLFGIIPDEWLFPTLQPQSFAKKTLWFLVTAPVWMLIAVGCMKWFSREESLFFLSFAALTFLLNLFLASRFRYMTPIIIAGLPFASKALYEFALPILKKDSHKTEGTNSPLSSETESG